MIRQFGKHVTFSTKQKWQLPPKRELILDQNWKIDSGNRKDLLAEK